MNLLIFLALYGIVSMSIRRVEPVAFVEAAVPLEEKAIFLPNVLLKVGKEGLLTGTFKKGKKQVFGVKGNPDLKAMAAWMKTLPKEKTVSIKVDEGAPQKQLIGVLNVLNEIGIDQITFTDILDDE